MKPEPMEYFDGVNTPEAIEKLELLKDFDDPIIKENARLQLEHLINRN